MEYRIEIKELKDFNELVDNIIEEIEAGNIKSNPLKPSLEEEKEEQIPVVEELELEIAKLPEDGNPLEILIINEDGEITAHYKNAVEMAKIYKIHPTTVRNRCAGNYCDDDNNTWYYRGKYEQAIS